MSVIRKLAVLQSLQDNWKVCVPARSAMWVASLCEICQGLNNEPRAVVEWQTEEKTTCNLFFCFGWPLHAHDKNDRQRQSAAEVRTPESNSNKLDDDVQYTLVPVPAVRRAPARGGVQLVLAPVRLCAQQPRSH